LKKIKDYNKIYRSLPKFYVKSNSENTLKNEIPSSKDRETCAYLGQTNSINQIIHFTLPSLLLGLDAVKRPQSQIYK